jgi:hypothetical protein
MNPARLAAALLVILLAFGVPAPAQDLPLVRSLLQSMVIEELSSHDSEDSAWCDDHTKRKKKIFQMNFFGREIDQQVASWTEETKSWIWIEQPDESLSLELTQFEPRDGRLYFGLAGRAKLGFRVWGRIQRLAKGNASGTVHVKFTLEGSTSMANGGLADSQITNLQGKLRELQFNNDLASPLEKLVVNALNDHDQNKNKKLRRSVEKAIDRVKF